MPIEISVFDFRCFNQLRNGENFDRNLSEFTPNLVGNVGERILVEYQISIGQNANTEGVDEWFIENNVNVKEIRRSSGSFFDDGIQVGDQYDFYSNWQDRKIAGPLGSEYVGQVEAISGDGRVLTYSVLFGTDSTNGPVTNMGLLFSQSNFANRNGALFVKFGLIENEETFNFLSKTTGSQQIYYLSGLVPGNIRQGESLGVIKDWVTGKLSTESVVIPPSLGESQFTVRHEFVLNPFYILAYREFIENGTVPEIFEGDSSLKYAVELEFRKTLTNTGSSKVGQYDSLGGFVGWYGENFNGLNPDYRIASITYEDAVTADPLDGINISTSTKAIITLENINGPITNYSCAAYIFRVPDSEDDYIGTASDLIENFILKSAIVSSPDTSNTNIVTSLVGGNLVIEYTVDYTTAEKLQLSTDDEFILLVQVEDPTISAGNSDRIMLIADFKNYVDVDFLAGFIQVNTYGFLLHGQTLGDDSPGSTEVISNEDGIILQAVFGSDTTKNVIINEISAVLLAFNPVQNTSFELDRYDFNLGDPIIENNARQLSVDTTRGYPLPPGDQFNLVRVVTGQVSGDFQQYELVIGQKTKWQDWIFNPGVDNVFFDANQPNNNLNEKSSNYSGKQGYDIRLALIINVTGEDDLGRILTGDFINYGGVLTVNDYDESDDGVSGVIQTFDLETMQPLQGNILYNGKDTLFRAVFQNAAAMTYGIHRIEPSLNQGDGILELSSILPSVDNNLLKPLEGETQLSFTFLGSDLTTECRIDGGLIQEGVNYKLSARVGVIPQGFSFFTSWDTNNTSTGSSASNQVALPLLATGVYNFLVDWGDGNQDFITAWDQPEATHTYAAPGVYQINFGGLVQGWSFNDAGDKLKLLSVSQWGSFQLTNESDFFGCANLDITAIDELNIAGVTDFTSLFEGCSSLVYNATINDWDTSPIETFAQMFSGCTSFNQNLNNWDTSASNNFSLMFFSCTVFNGNLSGWSVSGNLSSMFENCAAFTGNTVTTWVVNPTVCFRTFKACDLFNPSTMTNWNVSGCSSFQEMFDNCDILNTNFTGWTLGPNALCTSMFRSCTAFVGTGLDTWTANMSNIQSMFRFTPNFNTSVNQFNITNVTFLTNVFEGSAYNQSLAGWNTANVRLMGFCFASSSFNNSSITGWNTASLESLLNTFANNTVFNQNLASWNVTALTDATNCLLNATGFSTTNLDNLYIGWEAQAVQNNVVFSAQSTQYTIAVSGAARGRLISDHFWTIQNAGGV